MSQMRPGLFLWGWLCVSTLALATEPAPQAPETAPRPTIEESLARLRKAGKGALAERLNAALQQAQAQQKKLGRGHVLVGRVVLSGGTGRLEQLNSQVTWVGEGWFVTLAEDLRRPIPLRLHGYEAVDVPTQGLAPAEILSLGEITLHPLAPGKPGLVRGSVVSSQPKARLQVYAFISPGDVNTPSGMVEGDRPAVRLSVQMEKDGSFQLGGLTPAPASYELWVKAPGHVSQRRVVRVEPGQMQNLREIRLEKPRRLRVRYLVSSTPPPFRDAKVREAVVEGGQDFKADPKMKGATFSLEQRPKGEKLRFSHHPARLARLGQGTLEDSRGLSPDAVSFVSPFEVDFEPGHLYLLDHRAAGQWVLFQLEPVVEPEKKP